MKQFLKTKKNWKTDVKQFWDNTFIFINVQPIIKYFLKTYLWIDNHSNNINIVPIKF